MTEKQRLVLSVMQMNEPITAAEISRLTTILSPSAVSAVAGRMVHDGYLRIETSPHANRPSYYFKLREPVDPRKVRQLSYTRQGPGYNRVSLPVEPWAAA